ncbi:ATP-binding protein [Monaibacterium marinum]|uniref:ATP-binding protein n=1 Tax=Pontivivens marinum TaxID=1690039 RepID=UPI0015E12129|nr:ATP-binding protein [Monaibacterium marinum]
MSLPRLERGRGLTIGAPGAAKDSATLDDQLYSASPIARKIVLFNLLAQAVMVIGILFLSQYERSLVEQRAQGLTRDGLLIARTVSSFATQQDRAVLDNVAADGIVQDVGDLTGARVRLFDADGDLVSDTRGTSEQTVPQAAEQQGASAGQAAVYLFDLVIDRIVALLRRVEDADRAALSREELDVFIAQSMGGTSQQIVNRDDTGDYILSISIPVIARNEPIGVLVLSTRSGDISLLVSNERRQMMTVFLLALTVSIGLSVVLANSIARPLRALARAAQRASRSTRDMAPERIHFPDLTGRPDEIGNLSRALILMTQALYERIEANEEFAADVAHEIKNPLTSLRSAVETMEYAKTDEQRKRLLDVIANDVQRLDRLVTDISNASRLDSELVREEMEAFDLNLLIGSLVEYNSAEAAKVDVKLVADTPEPAVVVSGLEGRLAQVFINLITNAVSFTPPDGTVSVRVSVERDRAIIVVSDTGPGIPPDNLKDVFSRFYSERPGQEFGSHSGLGLAISKQIVEAHNGRIFARNIQNAQGDVMGAQFTVELPM